MKVSITVNDELFTREVEARLLLVHFLRDELGLTGTHWGCDTSNCGACVILYDGEPVKSCTVLAAMADGHAVRTVEDLEQGDVLDPVQQGFMECHGLQCGFCTPGMLMSARALLDRNPHPTGQEVREAISGQICRCTGYASIVRSVQWAAEHPHGRAVMTELSEPTVIRGHGRMLRKEDKRFVRGKGRYCDDIQLPGMLHLAVLRSPVAHARLVSIDTSAAEAHPKVKAVVTGAMLAERGLAWMPTLSGDVQAVLATDKVRFQGQEVAFVVAEDRYAARDALELIDVEYDVLEPVVDVRHALDPETPLIRDDVEGKTDNHCFDWETGDAAETAAVFARADVTIEQEIVFPRVHPAPLETCGAVADYDRIEEKLTLTCTTQAPHVAPHAVRRLRRHPRAPDPDHLARHRRRLRQQGPDLSGLRVRHRRLDDHRPAGEVDRGPHREPHRQRLRPRLHHEGRDRRVAGRPDPRGPQPRPGRPRRLQRHRGADEVPRRLLRRLHRQLRPRGGVLLDDRGAHQQGARRRRLRLLVPDRGGGLPRRAAGRPARRRAGRRSGRAAAAELPASRAVPVHEPHRLDLRLRRLRDHDARGAADRGVRRPPPRAGREARARRRGRAEPDGDRCLVLHRGRRRRAARHDGHGGPRHGRRLRGPDPPQRQGGRPAVGDDPGPGPRDDVRADRRRGDRHPPRRHRRRPGRHRQHAVRARHLRQPLHAGLGRGGGAASPARSATRPG